MSGAVPQRIVDSHVHFWDPGRTDWYPYLAGMRELDMGDVSGMARFFDEEIYLAESTGWNVEKVVHVAAAASRFTTAETLEKEAIGDRTGMVAAIVGGIVPAAPLPELRRLLDQQQAATRFRGVRPMGGPLAEMRPEAYRELQKRDLVFDVLAHPDELDAAAAALAPWPDLMVVVDHMGWPRSGDADEFSLWRSGMARLASLGDQVHCKLSGIAVPLGSMAVDVLKPWFEVCLDLFGVDRCLFASNFPVDGMRGSFSELFDTYTELVAGFDAETRDRLFATNAERIYRC